MHTPTTGPGKAAIVVLASGSRYRRELLGRLLTDFEIDVPDIDESPQSGERPDALSVRLARQKAEAVARRHPAAVVIGSDQVAALGERALGKPGSSERAVDQLVACSGREIVLHTAVCVCGPDGRLSEHRDDTRLQFRSLSLEQISRYVEREKPLDCAGSFKIEGLGSALFSTVNTRDPAAIQGLPLLWLAERLGYHGVAVL